MRTVLTVLGTRPEITKLSPVLPLLDAAFTHIVDADRALILGGPTTTPLLQALAWLTVLTALIVPLALRRYHLATQ